MSILNITYLSSLCGASLPFEYEVVVHASAFKDGVVMLIYYSRQIRVQLGCHDLGQELRQSMDRSKQLEAKSIKWITVFRRTKYKSMAPLTRNMLFLC
jgi:hypothetical protein